jgi:hypothetical protein
MQQEEEELRRRRYGFPPSKVADSGPDMAPVERKHTKVNSNGVEEGSKGSRGGGKLLLHPMNYTKNREGNWKEKEGVKRVVGETKRLDWAEVMARPGPPR